MRTVDLEIAYTSPGDIPEHVERPSFFLLHLSLISFLSLIRVAPFEVVYYIRTAIPTLQAFYFFFSTYTLPLIYWNYVMQLYTPLRS